MNAEGSQGYIACRTRAILALQGVAHTGGGPGSQRSPGDRACSLALHLAQVQGVDHKPLTQQQQAGG